MNLFHRTQKLVAVKVDPLQSTSYSLRLKELVPKDERMYFALENFLLAGGNGQIDRLGEVSDLLARGNSAKAKGNNQSARIDYETAAKIEIYKQNKDGARNCLILAEGVSEKEQLHREFHKTMLADIDEVLRISKAYHDFHHSDSVNVVHDSGPVLSQ
jgi:hypothetical protein